MSHCYYREIKLAWNLFSEGTGELLLVQSLDRETTNSYTFNVQATDGTNTDTAAITINVGDVNDNDPIFNPTKYRSVER